MSRTEYELSRTKFKRLIDRLLFRYGGRMSLSTLCRILVARGYDSYGLVEALRQLDGLFVDEPFDTIMVNGLWEVSKSG